MGALAKSTFACSGVKESRSLFLCPQSSLSLFCTPPDESCSASPTHGPEHTWGYLEIHSSVLHPRVISKLFCSEVWCKQVYQGEETRVLNEIQDHLGPKFN